MHELCLFLWNSIMGWKSHGFFASQCGSSHENITEISLTLIWSSGLPKMTQGNTYIFVGWLTSCETLLQSKQFEQWTLCYHKPLTQRLSHAGFNQEAKIYLTQKSPGSSDTQLIIICLGKRLVNNVFVFWKNIFCSPTFEFLFSSFPQIFSQMLM